MTNKTDITKCPVCENNNVKRVNRSLSIKYFDDDLKVNCPHLQCEECGYEEVIDEGYNSSLKAAKKISSKKIMEECINSLNIGGYKNVNIERNLGLPLRTLNRWTSSSGEAPSSTAMVLFIFLKKLPWLVDFAAEKFSNEFLNFVMMKEGLNVLNENYCVNYSFDEQGDAHSLTISNSSVSAVGDNTYNEFHSTEASGNVASIGA